MRLFVGVDGGGTKTRALAVTEEGICLGHAVEGASNPNSVGAERARENLVKSICTATEKFPAESITGFLGISGVNDSKTAREMENELRRETRIHFEQVQVENDTRSLCAAAFPTSSGLVLIAGTGSKCYGRALSGKEWETGGYDFHVSDEASAFDLARRGLIAAVRAADGRGNATMLKDLFFEKLQISEVGQISQRLHQNSLKFPGKPMAKDEIAALALLVDQAYLAGDLVAKEILEAAMADLVCMVRTVAGKLDLLETSSLQLAITGGVILNEPCRSIFQRALGKACPNCQIIEPKLAPVIGATIRALNLGGIPITPAILKNLETIKV